VCLKNTDTIEAFLLIENKIKKESITTGQLEKQLKYFKEFDGDYEDNIPVYSIYITPDEEIFKFLYESAVKESGNVIWLKWINHTENDKSVEA
jgi:hypothetical protein